jgi:hypothetical protein
MNDGVTNRTIQIENIEAKMASTGNMKYVLKDSEGNKYFFWQKNKGQDSEVFLSFTGMGLKKGDTCTIGYTEKDESFVNAKGETIHYKDRFILGLREASGPVTPPSPKPASQPRSEAPTRSQGHSDDFSRRLGVQGHINALLSNPNALASYPMVRDEEIAKIIELAMKIEDEAEKQLQGFQPAGWPSTDPLKPITGKDKFRAAAGLPVVEEGEPLPAEPGLSAEEVEDIPF